MTISISPVQTRADRLAFYNFARQVYRRDPCWVPHLWPQRKAYLERRAAFFTYGEGEFWLARRGREIVGTIGTAIDPPRNQHLGIQAAVFGFFEVLPGDYEAAAAMWDHAREWARSRGMTELQGPFSFTGSDDPGFLIAGFDTLPAILLTHTPPYYAEYAARYGFQKLGEGLAYRFDAAALNNDAANLPPVIERIAERALTRCGPTVLRSPRMSEWEREIERLHPVYNRSLSVLPEFAPLEAAEFRTQAEALKPLIDPDLVFLAEINGEAVGFALGLPNINEALRYANGLRYAWDYARFALARRRVRSASFKILAVIPEYWGYGLEALMFREMARAVLRKGYKWIDASMTAEDNPQTNKLALRLGGRVYRRYRQYRLAL